MTYVLIMSRAIKYKKVKLKFYLEIKFLFDGYLIKVHRRSANMQIINGFLFDGYLIEN